MLEVPRYAIIKDDIIPIQISIKSTVKSQNQRKFRGISKLIIRNSKNLIIFGSSLILDGNTIFQLKIADDMKIQNIEDDEMFFVDLETTEELTGL